MARPDVSHLRIEIPTAKLPEPKHERKGRLPILIVDGEEVTQKMLDAFRDIIAEGRSILIACRKAGFSHDTYYRYKHKIEHPETIQTKEEEAALQALIYAFEWGRALWRDSRIGKIQAADDWRSDAWLLERVESERFGVGKAKGGDGDKEVKTRIRFNKRAIPKDGLDQGVEVEVTTSSTVSEPEPREEPKIIDVTSSSDK